MKIAVIGAMEEEVNFYVKKSIQHRATTIAGCEFIEGKIGEHDVVLVKSGIGKVNAAIATTLLLKQFQAGCRSQYRFGRWIPRVT